MTATAETPAPEPVEPTAPSAEPSFAPVSARTTAGGAAAWADEDEADRDDEIWSGDPADWPSDEAAWPDGQEAFPGEDREPPVPEEFLLACDPDVGPPAPADCVPAELWATEPGRPRVPEAFAAGFTHREAPRWGPEYAVPSRSGFAAGGPADTLEPGPVLAGLAGRAWDDGLGGLGDDELIGVLCAARRVTSWQAALEFAAVTELDARRTASARRLAAAGRVTDLRAATHTSEELAAALVLTGRAADTLVDLAAGLARLPAVCATLAEGAIDRARAVIFADELTALDDTDAAAVAARILPGAAGLTTGQLRAALRRAVLTVDPAAARRRREKAVARARVEIWAENSGNSALACRELPPATAIACDRYLDATAEGLRAAGVPGTLDALRAGISAALLSGRSPESLLPVPGPAPTRTHPADGSAAGPRWPSPAAADSASAEPGSGSAEPGSGSAEPGSEPGSAGSGPGLAWPAGPLGSVHLTMPLTAWLGLSEAPGLVDRVGPADAGTCRDLATGLAARAGTRWCLTITDPDGRALGHACARKGPPGTTGPPGSGPTSAARPPGAGPPGASPPGTGPPGTSPPGAGSPGIAGWLAGLTVQWLETDPCRHVRQTIRYRPTAQLHHLVKVRNPTCGFPGCRRPARRCDDDHTVPYDQGGRTCECNLNPLCRRHHQTKQASGWYLEQPRPGVLTWTAPHGRRYTSTAEPYPV